MGHAIRELDPSAVFEICQDPGENFAGQRIVFHPEYGEHHSAGTRDGAALLDANLVLVHLERIRPRWTPAPTPAPPSMASTAPPAGPGPATWPAAAASAASSPSTRP